MHRDELLAIADHCNRFELTFKSASTDDKQIVYGEVYVPGVIDTGGEMMLAEDVELMAHRFLATFKNDQIDVMHNNRVVRAVAVESFIAREGDPTFIEGAWVLALKIEDAQLWADIKAGKYNGFSMESWVAKTEAIAEMEFLPQVFGVTEETDGHEHVFFVQLDDMGNVVGGTTSPGEDGHVHKIQMATATEMHDSHAHRFSLP